MEDVVVEAEAEAEAEATSSTSPKEGEAKGSIYFSAPAPRVGKRVKRSPREERKSFFAFGLNLAYIPVAPDSFGATGCPRSRGADVSIDELKLGLLISLLCVLIHAIHL